MSDAALDKLTWLAAPEGGLAPPDPAHERPHAPKPDADPMTTETYWFCFTDPKTKLTGHFYMKIRQTFGGMCAGAFFYRGLNGFNPMALDHYDWHTSIPAAKMVDNIIATDLVGLSFEMLEPMQSWRVRYDSHDGNAEADIAFSALTPMAVSPRGTHFDQAVWAHGTVRVGEETFVLDCPGFRDRTWDEPRPETTLVHPPLAYLWGTSHDGNTAFCIRGSDDPASNPDWVGRYALTSEQAFHGGWIYSDGQLVTVRTMSKRAVRDLEDKARPLAYDIDFTDDRGRDYRLTCGISGDMWFFPWGNIMARLSTFHWQLDDGAAGLGESQDCTWTEYARRFWKPGLRR